MLKAIPTPFANRTRAKEFFEQSFAQVFPVKEDPQVLSQFLMANLKENSSGVWDWQFSASAMIESVRQGRAEEAWSFVQNLKTPTLWIRGESSKELTRESFQRILNSNSMIQGVTIPQAGHWVHSENREAFVAALKNFTDL